MSRDIVVPQKGGLTHADLGKKREVIEKIGGASRARTDDLLVANEALSQLSYSPTLISWNI